jgi:hypothetical protein
MQIVEHLQFGETDIDAIDIRDDVADEENRHQPPRHLAEQVGVACGFNGVRHRQ